MNGFFRDLTMTKKIHSKNAGPRILHWSVCVGTLALLVACGGSGGGFAEPVPRIETTTVGGVAGVRDNVSGHIWAAQPGVVPGSIQPQAHELLGLIDLGADAISAYFGAALGQSLQAAESVPDSLWVVDFGRDTAGRLSNEVTNPNPSEPYLQWHLLSRAATSTPGLVLVDNGTVIQGTSLVWSLCTQPTTYQDGSCVGTPLPYTLAQAQALAAQSKLGSSAGWRLPTKQELQALLRLESTGSAQQPSLLPEPFANRDVLTGAKPLQYWTSSSHKRTAQLEEPWTVDFSAVEDPGGVEPINQEGFALVRLVRNR